MIQAVVFDTKSPDREAREPFLDGNTLTQLRRTKVR
jgi:hypothetical protein